MADPLLPHSYPDISDDPGWGSDSGSPPSMPPWVKVFGIAFLVLVLLIVVMFAGGHGPGRHIMSGAGVGGQTPPSSITAHGVYQP